MCHIIVNSGNNGYFYYDEKVKLLIGYKHFRIINNQLWSCYREHCYNKIKINKGIVTVTDNLTKQDLIFEIPDFEPGAINVRTKIKAGMHIDPIFQIYFTGLEKNYELLEPTLRVYNNCTKISIPVFFRSKDIAFYDGNVVSVKKFFIYPTEKISALYEEISNKFSFVKCDINKIKSNYMEIYNILKGK